MGTLMDSREQRWLNHASPVNKVVKLGDRMQLMDDDGIYNGGQAVGARVVGGATPIVANDLVYPSGYNTSEGLIVVLAADADTDSKQRDIYWSPSAIATGAVGTVFRTGTYIPTSPAVNGSVGDPVYLSTTAGKVATSAPTGANFVREIGTIVVSGADGRINVDLGGENITQHDHTDNASGGTISIGGGLTGTTVTTWIVNSGGSQLILDTTGLGANRTWTYPDESDQTAGIASAQTFTNKTLTTPTIGEFTNAGHDHTNPAGGGTITIPSIAGTTNATFTVNSDGFGLILSSSGLTAARTWTVPDASDQVVGLVAGQVLTNKTLTAPVINGIVTTTGLTLPAYTAAGAINFDNQNMTNVDIDSGAIDGVTLGGTSLVTIADMDINGGSIDGVTIGAAVAPTVTDLGSVATCDINGGTIDGVTIGATTPPTVTDLGSVANCDINGGAIDGTVIGAAAAANVTGSTITGTSFTDGTATLTSGALTGATIDGDQNTIKDLSVESPKAGAIASKVGQALTFVVVFEPTAAETLSYTVPSGKTLRVLDAWGFKLGAGGGSGDVVDIKNNGTAIFTQENLNGVLDTDRFAFDGLDDTQDEVTTGNALQCVTLEGGGSVDSLIYVLCMWV